MQLPEDCKEFIALMIGASVKFVMIGGFAYNLYRNPRATGGIDFLIDSSAENQKKLRAVLEKFGFGQVLPADNLPLVEGGEMLMLGRSPLRIDLLTEIDGISVVDVFDTA